MTDRKLNYIFGFIAIALFVLESGITVRFNVLTALGVTILAASISYLFKLLSLDGARAAIIVGTIAIGFGGSEAAVVIIAFFLTSSVIGMPFAKKLSGTDTFKKGVRRSGTQVWANSFWFLVFICLWYVLHADMLLVAAFATIATSTADTWATEVGTKFPKAKTILITTREKVESGVDGGISFPGTLAALLGAAFIGVLTLFFDKNYIYFAAIIVVISGFLGSLADSYLGAIYQFRNKRMPLFLGINSSQSNDYVNFLSTGIGGLIALILFNALFYVLV